MYIGLLLVLFIENMIQISRYTKSGILHAKGY